MEKFDVEKKGFMNKDDFIEFYREACETKVTVVWQNIEKHNIRNDLKSFD